MIVSPHAQSTEGWLKDRCSRVTGSAVVALYATVKTGEAAARADYRYQLAVERLTGTPEPQGFVSDAMLWGIEQEKFARMAYEAETGDMVIESGFVYLENIAAGGSVDGFIASDTNQYAGVWEAKCPKTKTHIKYLENGCVPREHIPQITHNVWVTGAEYAVFVSFDPRLPDNLQLFHTRVERAALDIESHEGMVIVFLREVDELELKLRTLRS